MKRFVAYGLLLAWGAGCQGPAQPPTPPGPSGTEAEGTPDPHPFPESLLLQLDRELRDLPEGAEKKMNPEERARLERLRRSKRGSDGDQEFLVRRILGEVIPGLRKDALPARPGAPAEPPAPSAPDGPDLVTLADGRKLRVKVVEVTADYVKFRSRFGTVKMERGQVAKIEYGADGPH
ncbi:MAG TPA: hypothetical protein VEN81_09500 [Planctomycetota bacterium]|nr:hypothetical protein [Planctomycetota bacterium]